MGLKEMQGLWFQCVKGRPAKTQKKKRQTALLLGISKVLLKAACCTCKDQNQKQGLSTSGISGNVNNIPPTRAEDCYCSQRCLNFMKDLCQLNVTLNHFSFSPQLQSRSSHLPFAPGRPLSTTCGDTATRELMPVLKNWCKLLPEDGIRT